MKIVVLKITPAPAGGGLRAYLDLKLADQLIVHQVRWIQQPGQRGFVQPPGMMTEQGGKKWLDRVVEWPPDWTQQISAAVAAYLSEHPNIARQIESVGKQTELAGLAVGRAGGVQ